MCLFACLCVCVHAREIFDARAPQLLQLHLRKGDATFQPQLGVSARDWQIDVQCDLDIVLITEVACWSMIRKSFHGRIMVLERRFQVSKNASTIKTSNLRGNRRFSEGRK
jgi:hypothetical protein